MVQQRGAFSETAATCWATKRLLFMDLLMPCQRLSAVESTGAYCAGKRFCT